MTTDWKVPLAAAEAVWQQHLGPLFDAEEARSVLGLESRQAVSDLARRGSLLALATSGGRRLYPAFQLSASGCPFPEVAVVLAAFAKAAETPYTVASWFVSPQDLLGGETPAAWMQARRDPVPLIEEARRAAARLAR